MGSVLGVGLGLLIADHLRDQDDTAAQVEPIVAAAVPGIGDFDCALPDGVPPRVRDRAGQREVASQAMAQATSEDYLVIDVLPSLVGPVAFVDGDLDLAAADLPDVTQLIAWSSRARAPEKRDLVEVVTDTTMTALAAVRTELPAVGGLTDVRADGAAGTVEIGWKGSPPPEVLSLVGTRADGIRVTVASRPYSRADLLLARDRLAAWAEQRNLVRPAIRPCESGQGLSLVSEWSVVDGSVDPTEASMAAGVPVTAEDRVHSYPF